jgi:hypothetical protein
MRRSPAVLLTAAALVLWAPAAPAQVLFDFETTPLFTFVPFSITQGGVTASFTSPDDNFFVGTGFFSALTGNVLQDADPLFSSLTIALGTPVPGIGLSFALDDPGGFGGSTLTLEAFLGATPVGTVTAGGTVPPGFASPEGALSFFGGPFDSVVLTSTAPNFAIDNVFVTPEPAAAVLTAGGLAALTGIGRLRRRAA